MLSNLDMETMKGEITSPQPSPTGEGENEFPPLEGTVRVGSEFQE